MLNIYINIYLYTALTDIPPAGVKKVHPFPVYE